MFEVFDRIFDYFNKLFNPELYQDEEIQKDNLVFSDSRYYWVSKYLWPKGENYRVIEIRGRFGLESYVNGKWIELECYDNGYDDYGKLHSGKWKLLRDCCLWNKKSLEALREDLLGIEPKKVIHD